MVDLSVKQAKKLMLSMLHSPPKMSFRLPKPPRHEKFYGYTSRYLHDYDADLPAVDDYMKDTGYYHWKAKGRHGKQCEMCGSDAETRYSNLTYGYLCAPCFQEWFDAEDELMEGLNK